MFAESYAGIYVPNLALKVAENNEAGKLPYINIVSVFP
jgi:carboxypeptidase C (cathepsin A)